MNSSKEVLAFSSFFDLVRQKVIEHLGEGYSVSRHDVMKNNSVETFNITVQKGDSRILPSIALNNYYSAYEMGMDIEEVVSGIISLYKKSIENLDDNGIIDYSFEHMRESIIYRLVNYEKNRSILEDIPHIRVMDLAVTFHCLIEEQFIGMGTVRIRNEHLEGWGITKEELVRLACRNTQKLFPPVIKEMDVILREIMARCNRGSDDSATEPEMEELFRTLSTGDGEGSYPAMYVATNDRGINGAACILYPGFLEEFRRTIGEDFYILPSSINEVILMPVSMAPDDRKLTDMVVDINRTQVPYEEVLSDRVYRFSEINLRQWS